MSWQPLGCCLLWQLLAAAEHHLDSGQALLAVALLNADVHIVLAGRVVLAVSLKRVCAATVCITARATKGARRARNPVSSPGCRGLLLGEPSFLRPGCWQSQQLAQVRGLCLEQVP